MPALAGRYTRQAERTEDSVIRAGRSMDYANFCEPPPAN
jgi:hypothetical protein